MGKKTHGPYLLQAIEANHHEKVHDICAKQIGNKEKVRELCVSQVRRLASEHTDVPLLLAAQLPDPSILQYLIHKHGVDINFVVKEQLGRRIKIKTALIMAVRRGLYDLVEVMLSSNADPNVQDHKGRTPLHHSVRKADFRMAKMLLSRGAQPSLVDKGENTPLHVASIFGHVELCKMLIHYGGDLYKKGQLGAIPIHIAAKEGHVALLRLFCQHDVNPNIKMPCYDGREKAALHVAAEEGHHECVSCLVEVLGADPNLGDSEGETPLNCCVLREYDPMGMKSKEDYTEAVKVLLRNGAEVNLQNGRGETALHLAARNEFHKIVELLLQAGIDPLIEDNSGDKAIDLVNEEDAVTLQIIKQAMENREKYLNDVFEMKAKGYSTSLDVLSSAGRSTSTLNARNDSLNESLRGRASSTPGLLGLPPHQMTYEGYLQPLRNGELPVRAQIHNDSRSSKSHSSSSAHETSSQINHPQLDKTPEQTYAKIDPDETFEEPKGQAKGPTDMQSNIATPDKGKKSNFGLPKFLKKGKSKESLLERKASQISSDSSYFDDKSYQNHQTARTPEKATENAAQKRTIMPIEQGTRKLPSPPPSDIRDSMLSSDVSGIWDLTPRSSTSTFRPDSDFGVGKKTDELMQKLQQNLAARKQEYSDINTTQYESLPGVGSISQPKGRSTPTPVRAAPSPKVQRAQQAPIATQDQQNGLSDSDDTFFDDESFDSVSEATVEMVQQQQQKIQNANKELFGDNGKRSKDDPHMQNWLSEQATLVQQRNYKNAGPLAHSTPPGSKITSAMPFSDTDDQFTSVSQQVGKPKPLKNKPQKLDKNANAKPMPPPRPPKERSTSLESSDSFRRPLPPAPRENSSHKKQKVPSTSSVETESNLVHLEVDEKEPGQTVIRIMPLNKKQPASPKMTKHIQSESSTSYATSAPTSMSTFTGNADNKMGRDKTGRHGSQGYHAGVLDTDSEVMSEMSYSTTSSFFKPVPKKRASVPKHPQISKRDKKDSPTNSKHLRTIQSQESEDFDSDFSDFSESDEESPNTAHMTARFFAAGSGEGQLSQFHITDDILEKEPPTPPTPTTPTIKMTMQMPELKKVLPEPPPRTEDRNKILPQPPPKTNIKHKVLPEPPPKVAPKPVQKPETQAKPAKDSPKIAKKPVLPKREDKPKPEPPSKPPPQKAVVIQPAPAAIEETDPNDDTFSMGSFSDGSDIEEPLPPPQPQPKPVAPPKPAARPTVVVSEEKKEEKVEEKPKTKTTKTKKKKKKVKGSKENTPEKPAAVIQLDKSPISDISVDTAPSIQAPPVSNVSSSQPSTISQPPVPTEPVDDTYMQPVSVPTIPIEANPNPSPEPAVLTARQKRKMKRHKSQGNTIDNSPATEEMKPIEPAVYSNSPPPRAKIQHTTSNKEGVPYAMVERKAKKADEKGGPVFVKVDPGGSDISEDNGAPPLPAPLESPYAEISVVDEMVRPNDTLEDKDKSRSQEALDLDSPKRRVTIGQKEFIPNNVKRAKDHDHRRIVYNCGEKIDFDIIGGNADGVFVHNIRQGSSAENAGLRNGDKILRINGRSTAGKTREDVTTLVNSIKRVMDVLVRERRDIYETILEHNGIGDAFCVRAHFTYKPTQQGELVVKPGDIFSVKDTLPNNTFGYWRAVKLNPAPREQPAGYILNMRRAEQLSLDHRMAQLKAFERQKGGFMKKGFNRSKSLDRLKKGKSIEDLAVDARNTIAYEKIEQRTAPFPKPVLLLGLFCDHVRDLLAKEHPNLFQVPKEQVEFPKDANSKEPVNVEAIKNICYSNKHCLTILSPPAIQFLQKTDFNPIVIYLAPGSKAIVKIIRSRFAPQFDRKPSFLYDEAMAFEKQQSHLFTATVPYTENDSWFYTLQEMIKTLQDQPQWYVVKDEPEDNDEEEGYEAPSLPGSPVSPNMPQFPAPHPARLNRSMEHIPDPIENVLNIHAAGKDQRMRAQSSGAYLGGDTDSIGSGQRVPKSILKNKGYSSNNSDSGSASSASMSAPRSHGNVPPQFQRPPPGPTQPMGMRPPAPQHRQPPYQQPGYQTPPRPPMQQINSSYDGGFPNMATHAQVPRPGGGQPQQPAMHNPQPPTMMGFHPAFATMGNMAPSRHHANQNGKETPL